MIVNLTIEPRHINVELCHLSCIFSSLLVLLSQKAAAD